MDVNVKKLPNAEAEVLIELNEQDFKPYLEEAANEISKEVKISGFRPGNVPMDVLEQHVGKDMILNHALDKAIPKILTDVVKNEKIEVIARPKVEVVSKDPIKIKAVAPVYPEVKVEGYDNVKVKAKEVKLGDKEIEETIERVKKQFVEWKEVLRPIEKGDKVELDFEGFDEGGAPLEGTASKNHPIIVGENMMVPGFEDNLIGMKTGEEKDFELTFPKDYHKESFKNKKVKFHVKINKVEKPEYPELNEEFIEKVTGTKKPVEEFKSDVEKDLKKYKEQEARKSLEEELLNKFLDVAKVDFSDILIDEEVDYMLRDMRQNMQQKGIKFEDYLSHMKKTEDEIREEMKKEAKKRITLRFAINEIMNKEKIEVPEEKVNEQLSQIPNLPKDKEEQAKSQIANSLKIEQLFDRFITK
jgi:trigger factor